MLREMTLKTYLTKEQFAATGGIPPGYDVVHGNESLRYGIPWITPASGSFLNYIMTGKEIVLDLGSGGSTIFFAVRCQYVEAIEMEHSSWCDSVREALIKQEITNVNLMFRKGVDESIIEIEKFPDAHFDVICNDSLNRDQLLAVVLPKLKPNGILVLDNYADWAAFHETSTFTPGKFLKYYNMSNHGVLDFNQIGWYGSGTRVVFPLPLAGTYIAPMPLI